MKKTKKSEKAKVKVTDLSAKKNPKGGEGSTTTSGSGTVKAGWDLLTNK